MDEVKDWALSLLEFLATLSSGIIVGVVAAYHYTSTLSATIAGALVIVFGFLMGMIFMAVVARTFPHWHRMLDK